MKYHRCRQPGSVMGNYFIYLKPRLPPRDAAELLKLNPAAGVLYFNEVSLAKVRDASVPIRSKSK